MHSKLYERLTSLSRSAMLCIGALDAESGRPAVARPFLLLSRRRRDVSHFSPCIPTHPLALLEAVRVLVLAEETIIENRHQSHADLSFLRSAGPQYGSTPSASISSPQIAAFIVAPVMGRQRCRAATEPWLSLLIALLLRLRDVAICPRGRNLPRHKTPLDQPPLAGPRLLGQRFSNPRFGGCQHQPKLRNGNRKAGPCD